MGELSDIIRSIRDEMLAALDAPMPIEVDVSTHPMWPAHEYAGLYRVNVTGPHAGDITVHRTVYRTGGDIYSGDPLIDDWQLLLAPGPTSFDVDSI
ncbi:MAG: hypothetical protein KIH63_000300 [Candidatus Saccharibacteria bacterium]|nr:hypothetical protein [Candidatus Saccharibacteria bacterium]